MMCVTADEYEYLTEACKPFCYEGGEPVYMSDHEQAVGDRLGVAGLVTEVNVDGHFYDVITPLGRTAMMCYRAVNLAQI